MIPEIHCSIARADPSCIFLALLNLALFPVLRPDI